MTTTTPQGAGMVRRIEKSRTSRWGSPHLYVLSCGHFFAGEKRSDLKARQKVICPVCPVAPGDEYAAMNQVYPALDLRPPVAVLQQGASE